jgi:hypothetical protein
MPSISSLRQATRNVIVGAFAFALLAPACMQAQWLNQVDRGIPRTRDGKPDLAAKAPRRNGKPDLSGLWQVEGSSRKVLSSLFPPGVGLLPGGENGLGENDPQKYFLNVLADFKHGEEPLTPAGAARLGKIMQSTEKPPSLCGIPTVPLTELVPAPFKIVQNPGLTLVLYEGDNQFFRQIYTDGRTFPKDPQPSWLGYSVGRWDGDWFVVDAAGFNDRGSLDAMGHPHSEEMRVAERFHRRDVGHMEAEITITDSKTFTKPVAIRLSYRPLPDSDLLESFCTEGEKDLAHLPGQ